MIKQIQLRGISRTPSDRLTEDGGCAESLNVQTDGRELAPVIVPEDADLGLPESGADGEVIFIHKQPNYTNAITSKVNETDGQPVSCTLTAYSGGQAITMGNVTFSPQSVSSVGNTVILSGTPFNDGDAASAYFLYKGGVYKYLGSEIPVPVLRFIPETVASEDYQTWLGMTDEEKKETAIGEADFLGEKGRELGAISVMSSTLDIQGSDLESEWTFRRAVENGLYKFENWSYEPKYDVNDDFWIKPIITKMWEQINEVVHYNSIRGMLNMPVFVRYGVRLYDGTCYGVSIPILIAPFGSGSVTDIAENIIDVSMQSDMYKTTAGGATPVPYAYAISAAYKFCLNYVVKFITADAAIFNGWEDLVEGVDIFVSNMVNPYPDRTRFSLGTVTSTPDQGGSADFALKYETTAQLDPYGLTGFKEQEKNILQYSLFHLIKSYSLDEFKQVPSDSNTSLQEYMNMSADYLAVQKDLDEEDTYQTAHRFLEFNSRTYNNRMLVWDVAQKLGAGYPYPHCSPINQYWPNEFSIWYHIDTGEGIERVVKGGTTNQLMWYAWIAYPDSRCKKATMCMGVPSGQGRVLYSYKTIDMKPHPNLNISYAFFGLSQNAFLSDHFITAPLHEPDVDDVEYIKGTLIQSKVNNPWSFPASGRISVGSGSITGVATIARPLSPGQFGGFDLYVFTDEGIWGLPVNEDGTFSAPKNISRDVALSADSMVTIEQAVVFVTPQGVKLISGSDIQSISTFMNGRHYMPEEGLNRLLADHPVLADYVLAFNDPTPFMRFMSSCMAAYDYVGQRIIFFRTDEAYQYVYKLDTQTWHKMSVEGLGYYPVNALNSYPDCHLCVKETATGKYFVKNMSVVYDPAAEQQTLPALVISRPFDLGETDIRKVIRDLRVRGQFNRGDVQYILMGSFDGVNWRRLNSLRGGSYKLFRIALLCTMSPTERISWIDVDYETRFTNRLR